MAWLEHVLKLWAKTLTVSYSYFLTVTKQTVTISGSCSKTRCSFYILAACEAVKPFTVYNSNIYSV
jgi:hypothetical protein